MIGCRGERCYEAELYRLQGELRLERIRLEDLRAELESVRAEAAQLRERAVAAELRSP